MPLLLDQSQKSTQIITNASILADTISKQVRLLDTEQSNIQSTLKLVEDIQDIKVSIKYSVVCNLKQTSFLSFFLSNVDLS